ncbi:hypothetical protein F2Q69_00059349 [Brassica cretica]|uniref:Uncharacterized protein n=1 Tax=Brassica cretica TaxID=69181 RepID=A0A8S9RB67_BRACR|nr:hypothetical protein F2Q69_00059349 [Brassica cretica]
MCTEVFQFHVSSTSEPLYLHLQQPTPLYLHLQKLMSLLNTVRTPHTRTREITKKPFGLSIPLPGSDYNFTKETALAKKSSPLHQWLCQCLLIPEKVVMEISMG